MDVWPWSYPDLDDLTYYPLRPGCASALLKFQGAELPHVTSFLDDYVPGAAYTGVSRVETCDDFLFG